ncbi:MAG: hypothetical protein AABZ06_06900 [Bdellovibrionota bacterium]
MDINKSWVLVIMFGLAGVLSPTHAEESSSLPAISGFQSSAAGITANFQSCLDINPMLTQAVNVLAKDKTAAGVAPGASCGGSESGPDASKMSCENYSKDAIEAQQKALDDALKTLSCKKTQLDGLKSQLGCLTSQADNLASQIQALGEAYASNVNRFQQDLSKIKSVEGDREMQFQDVTEKLGGSEKTGSPGLLRIRENTKAMIAQMPLQIQGVKQMYKDIELQKKALDEQAKSRTMALTGDCFNTPKSYRCAPNGPPVSAREYILCRYEDNLLALGNVRQKGNTIFEAKAKANAQALSNLLDRIFASAPKNLMMPGSDKEAQQQFQQQMQQPIRIWNPANIESEFGNALSRYNEEGFYNKKRLNISGEVMRIMKSCYKTANNTVEQEKTRAGSFLGVAAANIKKLERETSVRVNEFLNQYSQQLSENMSVLVGQHMPVDVSRCQNAAPNTQTNCLDDLRRNMEGLLAGSVPQSEMNIVIPSKDPQSAIKFRCQGINGCITSLQNISRKLENEKKRLGQFKSDYVLKSNQSMQNYTRQMASILSIQSQALSNRLKSLNSNLASLGVRSAVDIKPVEGEQFEADEDGLYKAPKSVLKLIGGQMTPPMLDVHGENFSSALGGVTERANEIDEKMSRLNESKSFLVALGPKCSKEKLEKQVNVLSSVTDRFANTNCGSIGEGWCEKFRDDFVRLANDVGTILGDTDLSSESNMIKESLETGAECANAPAPAPAPAPATVQIKRFCNSVTRDVDKYLDKMRRIKKDFESEAGSAE